MSTRSPFIAIVGLPNVGKSTLFNRIVGEQKAVVEDFAGVTRDRNYCLVDRFSIPFMLIDTGGFDAGQNDPLQRLVYEQTMLAMEEADVIFVVFDGDAGVRPGDEEIVALLRRSAKQVYYLVNKVDGIEQEMKAADFYSLGLEELITVSALRGNAVPAFVERALQSLPNYPVLKQSWEDRKEAAAREKAEMQFELEEAARRYITDEEDEEDESGAALEKDAGPAEDHEFPPVFVPDTDEYAAVREYEQRFRVRPLEDVADEDDLEEERATESEVAAEAAPAEETQPIIRIAIIGRPNVGKSTLLNTLVGSERAITSDISGTTRDSIDTLLRRDGQDYIITDTAGLRRQGRVANQVEEYSALRALRALSDCDVAVVVLDGIEGPTAQDAKIVGLAHEAGRGVILAVNKWDVVTKDHRTVQSFKTRIGEMFKFAPYAPILFISAKTGRRCAHIVAAARQIAIDRRRRIGTGELNRILSSAVKRAPLPLYRGRPLKLYFGAQVGVAPPRFALFFNHPRGVHFSTVRYLKNAIRENFGFVGSDIKLLVRKRSGQEQRLSE